jgi:hypothetical protein
MVGPLPAGRPWTAEELAHLIDLLCSGMKTPAIARQLKRSTGAVYARIRTLKKASPLATSLPSDRLAFFRAEASSRRASLIFKGKPPRVRARHLALRTSGEPPG